MIAESEGADYRTLVHKGRKNQFIKDLSKHPGIIVRDGKGRLPSSAAGRYQYLKATWAGVARVCNLPDFSPHSQDVGAVELLRQRGALQHVLNNDFARAVEACKKEWASLPGANYAGQGMNSFAKLKRIYESALGSAAAGATAVADTITDNPGTSGTLAAVAVVGIFAFFF
jgi:lysozyme